MTRAAIIGVETPLRDDVTALLAEAEAVAARLYPGVPRRPVGPRSLAAPGIHVLVARIDGAALGLCAVIERGGGEVELKRLIVAERARGRGVGSALVREAEGLARRLGAGRIVLEVGVGNAEARALYARAGRSRPTRRCPSACSWSAPSRPDPMRENTEARVPNWPGRTTRRSGLRTVPAPRFRDIPPRSRST